MLQQKKIYFKKTAELRGTTTDKETQPERYDQIKTGLQAFVSNVLTALFIILAQPVQQEVNETAFRDFQHIRCLHLEHTRPNVADVNPTQANACQQEQANNDI